ncbi:MAG TPA: Rieske 2Fe-2S domain-containing protein [Thermoanaerobaculia bacterium]
MNRDLSERLESTIISSRAVKSVVGPIDSGLNRVFGSGPLRSIKLLFNGSWLGHPLHPLLTDVPVGAWTAALLLDLLALVFHLPTGRASSVAVGLGIAAALAAAAAGLMDWIDVNPPEKAVGAVHALLNTTATVLFAVSLVIRGKHMWHATPSAFALAVAGYLVLSLGAFLGGAMVYRMGVMINRNAYRSGPEDFLSALPSAELSDGQLRRELVGEEPILLVRRGEQIFAVGAVCSHYGAPLEEGKVVDGTIQCPWHASRFVLGDGAVREGPACAPLPSYEVRVAGGQVQVRRRP